MFNRKVWIRVYQQTFEKFVDEGLSEAEAEREASADVENQISDHGDHLYKERELW